jgi:hypothetical protein
VFYYPWYGTPDVDGDWIHWQQNGNHPPDHAASAFQPLLGFYSSRDQAIVDQHMSWIAGAGIGVAIASWWGQGSHEDRAVPQLLDSAARHGLHVAFHIEPYAERNAASVKSDIAYIYRHYGQHPGFFRVDRSGDPSAGGRGVFYIYESLATPTADWRVMLDGIRRTGIDAVALSQTSDMSHVALAHFNGLYTYDQLRVDTSIFRPVAGALAQRGALFAPSVGPGYDDTRAMPGSARVKSRDNGAEYARMWQRAIASGAPWITITSFNEWHEGTQIEPAVESPSGAPCSYEGAYGLTGKAAEYAYLDYTRAMVERFTAG